MKKPIDIIEEIIKKNPGLKVVFFVAYRYVPKSLNLKGRVTLIPIEVKNTDARSYMSSIRLKKSWDLTLCSKVKMKDNSIRHIPQIDFWCPISSKNKNLIKTKLIEVLKITPGFLLNSGNSYHFIGTKLLSEKQWQYLLGLCLLTTEPFKKSIIDVRWLGHQLMAGWSCLRIRASKLKPEPKLVTVLK